MDINIKLLEAVISYPNLYNKNHEKYFDNAEKSKSWDEIASKLKISNHLAKTRYTHLREAFYRSRKNKSCKYKYHELFAEIMDKKNQKDSDELPPPVKRNRPERRSVDRKPVQPNEDTILIEAVQCRPLLYNRSGVSNEVKTAIWNEVAENLNRTAEDCEKRFRNIRDAWRKTRKLEKNYKYDELLGFLLPYIDASILKDNNHNEDSLSGEQDNAEEDEEDNDNHDTVFIKPEVDTLDVADDMSCDHFEDDDIFQPSVAESAANTSSAVPPNPIIQSGDPLQMYLSSIYSTMRKFEPLQITILQKKIFDLVHEVQLEVDTKAQLKM